MLANMKSRKTILEEFYKSISIGESTESYTYEDIMKAFFDSSYDSEKSYKIIEAIKASMGDSYVNLIFANKNEPQELTKLISNAVTSIGAKGPIEVVDEFDVKDEPLDLEPSEDVETESTASDVGITVSTPNE